MTALALKQRPTDSSFLYNLLGKAVRKNLQSDCIVRLDFSHVSSSVEKWWQRNKDAPPAEQKVHIRQVITKTLKPTELETLKSYGKAESNIAAVLMLNVFETQNQRLALLVHEAISEIAGIVDVKYSYEEHKELKPHKSQLDSNIKVEKDWGRGLGSIQAHSDDLYEVRDINAMSLTVCRDISATPTSLWLLKDVLSVLTDTELGLLCSSNGNFHSGRNVNQEIIAIEKPILRIDKNDGMGMRLDFRIDERVGNRLQFQCKQVTIIQNKLSSNLKNVQPILSHPATGTVCLLANFRVLHGRQELAPHLLYEGENSRVLFRSKGVRV